MKSLVVGLLLLVSSTSFAQSNSGVIINEIGNNGTKKALYTGGDYVELLVVAADGAKLAGWYLTDLSSPSGTAKEKEGSVKFSEKEGSVFLNTIPPGTYILVCLGPKDELYGSSVVEEDVSLADGNNRVVVFAYNSPEHFEPGEGTLQCTGKDNVALVSAWEKTAAVSLVTWAGSSSWTGCKAVELAQESLENGMIVSFQPKGAAASDFVNIDPTAWESTSETNKATPGGKNNGVDDGTLRKK